MTDPELADVTYIEPINSEVIEKIIKIEKPDAILPTMGGQTALNIAIELDKAGTLKDYNVALIGANRDAIEKAEDRKLFKEVIERLKLKQPENITVSEKSNALRAAESISYPIIARHSFVLGRISMEIIHDSTK